MKHIYFFFFSFILFGCSPSTQISSNYSPYADFSAYKSFEYYGWMEYSDEILKDIDKDRIEKAFGKEFLSRGLDYVEEDGELIVALYITTDQKTKNTAVTTTVGVGYGGYYGPGWGWGGGVSSTSVNKKPYEQGTLICHVYDAEKEELIWEGTASRKLDNNPQNNAEVINFAVKKMMAKYPVKPSK